MHKFETHSYRLKYPTTYFTVTLNASSVWWTFLMLTNIRLSFCSLSTWRTTPQPSLKLGTVLWLVLHNELWTEVTYVTSRLRQWMWISLLLSCQPGSHLAIWKSWWDNKATRWKQLDFFHCLEGSCPRELPNTQKLLCDQKLNACWIKSKSFFKN